MAMFLAAAMAVMFSSNAAAAQPAPGPLSSPGPEVMVVSSCLGDNGRIDLNIVNPAVAADYEIRLGLLSPRVLRVSPLDWGRFSITGRQNGTYPLTVMRDGTLVLDTLVDVDCDGPIEGASSVAGPEVSVVNGCRFDRGYLLVQLLNDGPESKPYVITFDDGNIPNRSTTAAPYGAAVRAITGRLDGSYPILVRSEGEVIYRGVVTVACQAPWSDRADTATRVSKLAIPSDLDATVVDSGVSFTSELVAAWDQPRGSIVGLADGQIVSTSDSTMWIHSAGDATQRTQFALPSVVSRLTGLVQLADGRLAGIDGQTIRIFDPYNPVDLLSVPTPTPIIHLVAYADGRLAAMGTDSQIRVWSDFSDSPTILDLSDQVLAVAGGSLDVAPDGRLLAHFGVFSPLMLVDPDPLVDVEIVHAVGASPLVFDAALINSSKGVVVGSDGLWVWDLAGEFADGASLPGMSDSFYRSVVVLEDESIAAVNDDGQIDVWAPPYDTVPRRLIGAEASDLTSLGQGRIGTRDVEVTQLWDLGATTSARFPGHELAVSAVAVLPDGRIASGDVGGNVYVWDRDHMETPTVLTHRSVTQFPAVRALTGIDNGLLAVAIGSEVWLHDLKKPNFTQFFDLEEWEPAAMVANTDGWLAVHDASRLFVIDVDAELSISSTYIPEGFFNDLDAIDESRFITVDGVTAAILDPINRTFVRVEGLGDIRPARVTALDDGRIVFGRANVGPPVIFDLTGEEEPVELGITGTVVGQRANGDLVLQQLVGDYVVVDLADTSTIVETIERPGRTTTTTLADDLLLGSYATGWVLFE